MADDLRPRIVKVLHGAIGHTVDEIADRLEAVARAHASERIEGFVAGAAYCPFCGAHAEDPHTADCPYDNGDSFPEPSAETWSVDYEIRTGIDDAALGRGMVEVEGPYEADAHRHAKAWVSAEDTRFDRRVDPYTAIIRARPVEER